MAHEAETRDFHCSLSIAAFSSSFHIFPVVFISASIVLQVSRGRPLFLLPLSGVRLNAIFAWKHILFDTFWPVVHTKRPKTLTESDSIWRFFQHRFQKPPISSIHVQFSFLQYTIVYVWNDLCRSSRLEIQNNLLRVLICAFLVFFSCLYALFFLERCIN